MSLATSVLAEALNPLTKHLSLAQIKTKCGFPQGLAVGSTVNTEHPLSYCFEYEDSHDQNKFGKVLKPCFAKVIIVHS
jgi:hypothetical protein